MNVTINAIIALLLWLLLAALVFAQEPTDSVLDSIRQRKLAVAAEYEQATKLIQALERKDAAEKAYRELQQKEFERNEQLKADAKKAGEDKK